MLPRHKAIIAILVAVAPLAFLCFLLYSTAQTGKYMFPEYRRLVYINVNLEHASAKIYEMEAETHYLLFTEEPQHKDIILRAADSAISTLEETIQFTSIEEHRRKIIECIDRIFIMKKSVEKISQMAHSHSETYENQIRPLSIYAIELFCETLGIIIENGEPEKVTHLLVQGTENLILGNYFIGRYRMAKDMENAEKITEIFHKSLDTVDGLLGTSQPAAAEGALKALRSSLQDFNNSFEDLKKENDELLSDEVISMQIFRETTAALQEISDEIDSHMRAVSQAMLQENEESEPLTLALAIFSAVIIICLLIGLGFGRTLPKGPGNPRGPRGSQYQANNVNVIE